MEFESMDWDVELKRLSAAFKIDSPCFFADTREPEIGVQSLTLYSPLTDSEVDYPNFPRAGEAELSVEFSETYRFYSLDRLLPNMDGWDATEVMLRWDGSVIRILRSDGYAQPMAEALFCLGVLTDQIESGLDVTISAHEKIRLLLEFDARLAIL